jgi:hypothetical protein
MRRILGAVAVVCLCGIATACARPVGDFGRAQSGVLHDDIMPAVGTVRAAIGGEPVSSFNLTDEESEMHDRIWRFLVAPHAHDWFMDTVVELQRTRLIGAVDHAFQPSSYYKWLHQSRYASSRVRFNTVADDARTDADTAQSAFRSICKVIQIDDRRDTASRSLRGIEYDDVLKRHGENYLRISWFTRALRYRYEAYSFALDHLLVETPHEEAIEVDHRLSDLAIWVERAERGDFCVEAGLAIDDGRSALPSRVLRDAAGEGEYRK